MVKCKKFKVYYYLFLDPGALLSRISTKMTGNKSQHKTENYELRTLSSLRCIIFTPEANRRNKLISGPFPRYRGYKYTLGTAKNNKLVSIAMRRNIIGNVFTRYLQTDNTIVPQPGTPCAADWFEINIHNIWLNWRSWIVQCTQMILFFKTQVYI